MIKIKLNLASILFIFVVDEGYGVISDIMKLVEKVCLLLNLLLNKNILTTITILLCMCIQKNNKPFTQNRDR